MWILTPVRQAKAQIKKILGAISLSNGILVDSDGNFIAPYEFTWAEFITLTITEYTGITIRITDRHQDSRGVGGILVTGGASWTLESPQVYYSTFGAALTELGTLSNWTGWRITSGDVGGGRVRMFNNGTRFLPFNGSGVLLQEANGILAAPTKSLGSGAAPQLFTLSNGSTIPANLVQLGDKLIIKFHCQRHGTGAMTFVVALGTGGAVLTDAAVWTSGLSTTDLHVAAGDIVVNVGSTTAFTTTNTGGQATSGSAVVLVDRSTNVNFAADQTIKAGLSVKGTSSETFDLIAFSILWMTP